MGRIYSDISDTKIRTITACNDNHCYYNVGGANRLNIAAFQDGTCVTKNGKKIAVLHEQEVLSLSTGIAQGDVYCSNRPLSISGEEGAADIQIQPDWTANNILGTTVSRYGGITIHIYSVDATSVQIFRNNALVTTQALTPKAVYNFSQTGNYVGNWKIIANGQVIAYKREYNDGNGDSSPMIIPNSDIIGWASSAAYIASENANGNFNVHGNSGNYSGTIATTYNIVDSVDLPHSTNDARYFRPLCAIRVQDTNNLYANSRADSDGGNDTTFVPVNYMRTHHVIPHPSEFIAVQSLTNTPIFLRTASGATPISLTPTKSNANVLAPYAGRFGTENGASNYPAGTMIYSADPINVVYQPKGAGNFGSDDDESNSFGYNL